MASRAVSVVSRLQTANTEQVLQGIEAWVGMWTVAKYKVKYGAGLVGGRAGGWWQGWWLARLRNRKNSVGSLVNLMLEVTTNVPQDSPPQDFSEIYVLNTSSASSALDSIRLLTPLLGEIRNKSSRHLALRELQVKCGMFQIDPEPDGVRAPGDDVGLREDAPKEAFFDTGEPAAKRQKIGESLRTKQSSAEGGAGGTGRSGRERKAVRRLDPAEAMAKDRDALEKHKRASGCEGRRGGRCGRGQKGSASQYAPVVAPVPDDEAQWRREGNGYIGKRVRRSLWSNGDEPVVIGTADARIVGWLPKEESDFLDEAGQPAPLWHIVYENTQIGEEDLEEYEVKESLELFERGMPARDLPPNPATHAAGHAGHTAHPAVSSELSGHPPARSQATHAPERAATVRQAGANAAAPPPHSAAPIRAPGAQPPANNVPTEAHTVQALHAVAPASRSAEPAPQGQAAVAQVDAATGSPQARLHSVDSAYSVSCVAVAPALSETAMRGVGSASAPSRAPPLHTGSGGAEATQKAAAAAGAGAGGAGWAPAVAVATVVGVPGGGSAAQTSQGAPRVPTVSLDAARLTFSPVSAAAYGASGFFLPPCRSQDLTIFQLFCVVGVPFTIGARTLFPESYTAPPTLSWAQEYLRVDSRFQQSCEYAFDPFTNTLKGKFAIDGEFRVELLVKLTVGPSTVVGVDVYKCILNFTVKPQLAFTNYPPAIPVMISPCKPEYIALLPASHLPYSSFSCLEISDGHAVGAEQVGSWVQVDGQTGTISITLPRRFQAMQPLGHASTQRTLCFTIRCWNLMGWQQCQLTLELHSLPPPPEPALPPTIGAGTPAGALVPFVRPNEVKVCIMLVCMQA